MRAGKASDFILPLPFPLCYPKAVMIKSGLNVV
jgi:hypothetical protein